jgi:bacterioferritin-associated ferredoxin
MATTIRAGSDSPPKRAMTRCECSGVTFEEIGRRIKEEGLRVEDAQKLTGCGGTCTACIPDLLAYISSL